MFSCKTACKYILKKKKTTKRVTVVKSLKAKSLITRYPLLWLVSHSSFISWIYWPQAHTSTEQFTKMQKQPQIFSLEHRVRKGGWKYLPKIWKDKLFSYKKKSLHLQIPGVPSLLPTCQLGKSGGRFLNPGFTSEPPGDFLKKENNNNHNNLMSWSWSQRLWCNWSEMGDFTMQLSPEPQAVIKVDTSQQSITSPLKTCRQLESQYDESSRSLGILHTGYY